MNRWEFTAMANSIGTIFTVTTFGESHGPCVGVIIDGCPAGLELSEADVQPQLDRRRPGQSDLTTGRKEADAARILSGIENGITLGTPVTVVIDNKDRRPGDYRELKNIPRPSHADFTYRAKYGVSASSGGGRASARETAARVAAGAVAEKYLRVGHGVEIVAWVSSAGDIEAPDMSDGDFGRDTVDANAIRCPDAGVAEEMATIVKRAADEGDSVGGTVTCVCRNVPAGWGEPIFDKLEARLGAAMLSIPAVKGFEVGSGFAGTRMRGSEHNDVFVMKEGRLGTASNRSGGIQGGIANGEPVVFRAAFKPTATIKRAQQTIDYDGQQVRLEPRKGRHDPCVLPRAVPVVEAMAAIVLADMARMAVEPIG